MPDSIYKSFEGEAEILALYSEALAALGSGHGSLPVSTPYGGTHVLTVGPDDARRCCSCPGGTS